MLLPNQIYCLVFQYSSSLNSVVLLRRFFSMLPGETGYCERGTICSKYQNSFDRYPSASYFPEQEEFARKRIAKARELKKDLASIDVQDMSKEELDKLHYRYQEVDVAEAWAVRLLEEAMGAEV